jgi:mono/diheme cytochrome c family protein
MSPDGLLEQLGSPERWTRTQAKRLLFDAPSDEVLATADAFADTVSGERELLELIGIYEAHESPRPALLAKLLASGDPRIRAYATRVAGRWPGALPVLEEKARDANPRVRLEAVVASTYVETADAIQVVAAALDQERDPFIDYAVRLAAKALQPHWAPAFMEGDLSFASATQTGYFRKLAEEEPEPPSPGAQLYETACMTCHQPEGKGLPGVYPALAGSGRVSGADPESLIKIVLHGLAGPLAVGGQTFGNQPNSVPMPPMGGLSDQQIADVLTFVRKSYGKNASGVAPEDVASVRSANRDRATPWTAPEL